MALANVAWILAANGKRVLIADWDLESPGLHRFLAPFMDAGMSDQPGIIDFIRRYAWAVTEADLAPEALHDVKESRDAARPTIDAMIDEHIGRITSYAIPLSWQFPENGVLHFLSPGKQKNGDFRATLSNLDWDQLLQQAVRRPVPRRPARDLEEELRLRADRQPDRARRHVLISARCTCPIW